MPETCCASMASAGIELQSFNLSVAHGIHSINVEQLNYFFNVQVTEENDIPTTNFDLSSKEHVLMYAPKINNDRSIVTPSMMMLNFIMANNDDEDSFLIKGLSSLEKLAHSAHMAELYTRTKLAYDDIVNSRSVQPDHRAEARNDNLCQCVTDEENNGILERLSFISEYLREFTAPKGLRRAGIDFIYGTSFKYDNFEYGGKFKYSGISHNPGPGMNRPGISRLDVGAAKLHETPSTLPKLIDSDTWLAWKAMLNNSMPNEQERFNLAMYLYCKLN